MVLEKTLENPLDCEEIQPVHPKGNQYWIFIGRTNAEAETPILWPPDVKSLLLWKDPDAGKAWRQKEKGTTENDGSMAPLTRWTWVWASSQSWWWIGKPDVLQSMGLQRVGCNWTEDNIKFLEKELGFGEKSRNGDGPYGGFWPSKKSSRDHSHWVVFYCITLYILYYISFLEFCL